MGRTARIERKTGETDIILAVDLEGKGTLEGKTGIGFFDHMLTLFAKHGLFDINIEKCIGDWEIDFHHTVEDFGIVLGQAFKQALGAKAGIRRFGFAYVPMDESLARVVVDLSGRCYLKYTVGLRCEKVGDFDTETVQEFFKAFADNCLANINIELITGDNAHHDIEVIFKAWARALRMAVESDPRTSEIQSTKGVM